MNSQDGQVYRALVDDREYDIAIQDDRLVVDGEPKDYTFEVLREGYVSMIVDGKSLPVSVEPIGENTLRVTIDGRRTEVQVKDERDLLVEEFGLGDDAAAGGEVRAPMPGLVLDVLVDKGDEVAAEQGLLVLEAMKMENELKAPSGGIVTAIHATSGDAVEKDALLIAIEGQE
jgi:pyruvate carboxylase subunit B